MSEMNLKRATVKMKRPNPLFEKWLLEWKDEATGKTPVVADQLEKALESLRKYPLILNSGKECLILEHFNTQLCVRLDRRLVEHRKSIGIEGITDSAANTRGGAEEGSTKAPTKRSTPPQGKRKREYLPAYRSGSYALLVTLYKNQATPLYNGGVKKDVLIRDAQAATDSSFKRPQPGVFYTAWSSMAKLVQKNLVVKKANKFSLSKEGKDLAEKLVRGSAENGTGAEGSVSKVGHAEGSAAKLSSEDIASILAPAKPHGRAPRPRTPPLSPQPSIQSPQVILTPGNFQVFLLVDSKEIIGGKKKDEGGLLSGLESCGVRLEARGLKVGDFGWVARDSQGLELVLPYLVERKRLDDLAHSIKDTRFHEQKFRLKRCGLPNIIYLVEGCGRANPGLPLTHLAQAAINTQVSDNFTVRVTSDYRETIRYLATLTTLLTNMFRNKTLLSCSKDELPSCYNIEDDVVLLPTFVDFSHDAGKTKKLSVKEMFVKQLVQAHGISGDKAWSIGGRFPSPSSLIEALQESGPRALVDIRHGPLQRTIGPSIASLLHALYTLRTFP